MLFLFTPSEVCNVFKIQLFKIQLDKKYSFYFFSLKNYISWLFVVVLQNNDQNHNVLVTNIHIISICAQCDRLQCSPDSPELTTEDTGLSRGYYQVNLITHLVCPLMFLSPFYSSTGQSRSQQSLQWWQHWDTGWKAAHCGASSHGI